ncbi:hypothetical protein FGO68_gene5072 [Halteria grandinella]|uniref:Uncharacterized protein n=1 Tax=Halteria grandinella TaxID=5974 RepID=A0A8J8NGA6_HALGN|nr:hypothetical protein FGO68_gene5072 [Halteria grandinella]
MVRVQCKPYENAEQIKDQIMDAMNEYLQENDGYYILIIRKLINVKVIQNNQICVYFVTGIEMEDMNWEQQLSRGPLKQYVVLQNSIEVRPSRF